MKIFFLDFYRILNTPLLRNFIAFITKPNFIYAKIIWNLKSSQNLRGSFSKAINVLIERKTKENIKEET